MESTHMVKKNLINTTMTNNPMSVYFARRFRGLPRKEAQTPFLRYYNNHGMTSSQQSLLERKLKTIEKYIMDCILNRLSDFIFIIK
jgi:hypothetical protein